MAATDHGILYEGIFGKRRLGDGARHDARHGVSRRLDGEADYVGGRAATRRAGQAVVGRAGARYRTRDRLAASARWLRRQRIAAAASGTTADHAAPPADPYVRLRLPALGRQGGAIRQVARAVAEGAKKIGAAHSADVRSRHALAIRHQHQLGRAYRGSDQRRTAGRLFSQAHSRSARHERHRLRAYAAAARSARPACIDAGRTEF